MSDSSASASLKSRTWTGSVETSALSADLIAASESTIQTVGLCKPTGSSAIIRKRDNRPSNRTLSAHREVSFDVLARENKENYVLNRRGAAFTPGLPASPCAPGGRGNSLSFFP